MLCLQKLTNKQKSSVRIPQPSPSNLIHQLQPTHRTAEKFNIENGQIVADAENAETAFLLLR